MCSRHPTSVDIIFFLALSLMYALTALADAVDDLPPGHWYEVPDTSLASLDPEKSEQYNPNFPGKSPWAGYQGQKGVMSGWNGAAFDHKRGNLLVFGGGHNAYGGNEVYAFNVRTLQWTMLHPPCVNVDGINPQYSLGLLDDWTPSTFHTYNLPVYAANIDALVFARSGWFGGGRFSQTPDGDLSKTETQVFDLQTNRWETEVAKGRVRERNDGFGGTAGSMAVYDAKTGFIWRLGRGKGAHLERYDPVADHWRDFGKVRIDYYRAVAFDSKRSWITLSGINNGNARGKTGDTMIIKVGKPDSPSALQRKETAGERLAEAGRDMGFVYDPVGDQYVAWPGRHGGANPQDVYTLDPRQKPWLWKKITPDPGNETIPSDHERNGTFGRFAYIPERDAFLLVNRTTENVYFYRLDRSIK